MKKLISTKMKVFMVFLLITSITCFTSSMVVLYNSNFKLSDYTNWDNWFLGFNSTHYNHSYYNNNILDMPLSDIENLNFDFSDGTNINFETYPGSNLIINDSTNSDNNLTVTNVEGTLTIAPSAVSNAVLVKLPLNYAKNLNLKLTNGNVNLSDLTLTALKIETVSSNINMNNIKCPTANISSNNGDINLNKFLSTDLSIYSSNGDINTTNLEGNIAIKNISGDIDTHFNPSNTTKVVVDSTNGDVDLHLSQDSNCTIEYTTINGNVDDISKISLNQNTSISRNNKNAKIVIGTGSTPVLITTVSGDLNF